MMKFINLIGILLFVLALQLMDIYNFAWNIINHGTQGNVTLKDEKEEDNSLTTKKKSYFNDKIDSSSLYLSNYTLDYGTCTNNSVVPDNWCMDNNQIPRYVGNEDSPPQMIQHYTHDGYDKCLANKNVVFIGDSRVRYQFLHLASFLISKKFMKCQDYSIDKIDPECSLITHTPMAKDWNSFYKYTNDMLASNLSSSLNGENEEEKYQRKSLCDCYRPIPFRENLTYENRFLKRATPFGEVNLIFLQNFINHIRIHKEYPPFSSFTEQTDSNTTTRCTPGECNDHNKENIYSGDLNTTLWNILPQLNTTHAFISLGWEHVNNFQKQSDFSCTIKKFEYYHPNIKLFFISNPPKRDLVSNPNKLFNAKNLKCDCNVLDRTIMNKNVPPNWYWDEVHVLSIINEEYNHQLVEKICPIKK